MLVLFLLSSLFEFRETPIGTASTVLRLRKTKIWYVNFFTAGGRGGGGRNGRTNETSFDERSRAFLRQSPFVNHATKQSLSDPPLMEDVLKSCHAPRGYEIWKSSRVFPTEHPQRSVERVGVPVTPIPFVFFTLHFYAIFSRCRSTLSPTFCPPLRLRPFPSLSLLLRLPLESRITERGLVDCLNQ